MDHRTGSSRREFLAATAAGAAALAAPHATRATEAAPRFDRPLAMWALTGVLDADGVRRQLDAYAEARWGAVLYPRWGLELEYLGDAFFERIAFIVEQAAQRRMELWLYDEFCWPSGHAKGLVTQDRPDLEAQLLHVERDGSTRFATVHGSANLLDRRATARFLELTHERYAKALGGHLGTTVRAIFTDEPSLAMQHQGRPPGERSWRLAWSTEMATILGSDFPQRLNASGGEVAKSPLWATYWAAYTQVFHEAWVQPIASWCRAHRIAFSGHFLGEHSLGMQVAYNGSLRRQLGALGIPGIDEISTRVEPEKCEALTLASIAEFPGRERMVEVYALGPPSMSMGTMQRMVDLCAACGVDRYILAICPQDLRGGLFKREYLGVFGPQQPWFREYARLYGDYVAEAAVRARAARPLGLTWPADEDLWALAGPDPARSEPLKELTQKLVASAREAIRGRLAPAATSAPPAGRAVDAAWTFHAPMNSLRLDEAMFTVIDRPRSAALAVQAQWVKRVRLNGRALDFASAPADPMDASYRRVNVADLLRSGENTLEVETLEPKALKFLPALILWGEFATDAQGCLVAPPATIRCGDWRGQGYPAFCGTGRYSARVRFDTPPNRLVVDSGGYPVRVLLNGKDLGRRPFPPFAFDLRGAVKAGENDLVVEITSTLGHLFTARESPPIGLMGVHVE